MIHVKFLKRINGLTLDLWYNGKGLTIWYHNRHTARWIQAKCEVHTWLQYDRHLLSFLVWTTYWRRYDIPAQTILHSLRWRSCCIGIKYILQSVFAVSVYTKYAVPCYCTLVRCIKRWYEYLALMFINYWRCIIYFLSPSQLCLLLGFPCLHNLIFTCMSLMFFFFRFTEVCLCIAPGELLVIYCNM